MKDNPNVPDRFANCFGVINQQRRHVCPLAVVFLHLPTDKSDVEFVIEGMQLPHCC